MSWFHRDVVGDGSTILTLAPGVQLLRREFLYSSLAAIAMLGSNWPRALLARGDLRSDDALDWQAIVEQAVPRARELIESADPAEEQYLTELSGLAERLNAPPKGTFSGIQGPGVVYARSLDRFPLIVRQFRLEPGATIPFHDHRDYNGVLCVADGQVQIRSFDIVGPNKRPPVGTTFLIRENSSKLVGAGESSTLSRSRDNIHAVRATERGALLIDFLTFFSQDARSVYLDVASGSDATTSTVLEAAWAG